MLKKKQKHQQQFTDPQIRNDAETLSHKKRQKLAIITTAKTV